MTTASLLVELSTEELPPHALRAMGEAFSAGIVNRLQKLGLTDSPARFRSFSAPRHLAVLIEAVRAKGESRSARLKGPSLKVGLDAAGEPTLALIKWAEKQGVEIPSLRREGEAAQAHFVADKTLAGATLAGAIDEILDRTIAELPVPKLMRYQLEDGLTTVSFARPAHALVVLHGQDVIPATVLGLSSGRTTRGHRFLSSGAISIATADHFEATLRNAHVIGSFDERREIIVKALAEAAKREGRDIADDPSVSALINEVTALVEWPVVYAGGFDERYLQVPAECLILTMQTNQRYFPLFDARGALTNRFLIVSNMAVADPKRIVSGNERVVVPRLADAEFFYAQDRRHSLASRINKLNKVVYHARLGTQAERSRRVAKLAGAIATALDFDDPARALCERAAELAKTDLLTDMVGEFPELQGVMGEYYARHDGEDEAVSVAIREQYLPRFAGDALAATPVGTVVALADKLETLAGMFSIGQLPTGDRDPFALRRHTLGVIRILIEKPLPLSLPALLAECRQVFDADAQAMEKLAAFVHDRLNGYLRDQGHSANAIGAVIALQPPILAEVPARLTAVEEFARLPQAQSLAAANKRIGNILRKAGIEAGNQSEAPESGLYREAAERELAATIDGLAGPLQAALANHEYTLAMTRMAQVRDPVDHFFDQVMVMADEADVRSNRLRLLARVHSMMNQVADISGLANS